MLFLSSCAIKEPYNYYYKLAIIEKTGESIRADTGRKLGEKLNPILTQNQQNFIISFDENEQIYTTTLKEEITPIIGVRLKEDQLSSLLRQLGVNVIKVETIDGRLVGGKNSLRVSFVPKNEADEGKLLLEFSTICGAVYGFDKEQTVDVITAFAESRENLLPYMIIQASLKDIIALSEGKLSQNEWISKITIKRL